VRLADRGIPWSCVMLARYNGGGKEGAMPKRSRSQRVPKEMQARFDEITQITDAFGQKYVNEEHLIL